MKRLFRKIHTFNNYIDVLGEIFTNVITDEMRIYLRKIRDEEFKFYLSYYSNDGRLNTTEELIENSILRPSIFDLISQLEKIEQNIMTNFRPYLFELQDYLPQDFDLDNLYSSSEKYEN